jgi:hypothetical protein
MRLRLADRGERGERGAIAILTALLAVVMLAMAALAVDITSQVNERQKLHDTIDAAAHAGAYRLPNSGTQANLDAIAFAANNGLAAPPAVDFFCVVASKLVGGIWVVDNSQIPATCNPASAGGGYTGFRCNTRICSIPCSPAAGDLCNSVRVSATKTVPFSFAPVIGINQGSTGSVTSVACKGSCGTLPPNPMDVAVVADRTGSMSSGDITAMITGIKSMFQVMTPSQQYVALGTIGRSKEGANDTSCSGSSKALSEPSGDTTKGPWMPVPFSNDYLTAGTTTVNANSTLVKAVECLKNSSSTGTHLASPMKYAARYLLNMDANNLGSLPARTGTVRKAIIFETDGIPNESINGGSTTLSTSNDIGSTASDDTACNNLTTVATNAKTATPGILVVTVAFNVSTDKCSGASGSAKLVDKLAAAASPAASGAASAANFDCGTLAGRNSENADGDFFFCAASGTDMAVIFKTAFVQIANGIRLIALP